MHDWTMIGMEFGWREGVMKLHFLDRTSQMVEVVCSDVSEFQMSRRLDWGESVSVNRVEMVEAKGSMKLRIEIQSGDQIILVCGNVVGILGKESRQ
ncbi:MAG: hypothetical protein IPO40_19215 [Fibrobacteres bacterium]|nr:hypothetical protein [Fibrobacterota bacterium]